MTGIDAVANDMHASHLEPNASHEVPMKFPAIELLTLVTMPHLEFPFNVEVWEKPNPSNHTFMTSDQGFFQYLAVHSGLRSMKEVPAPIDA